MRRRKDRTEFAVWLKQETPSAIRLTAPLGFLEGQPLATEEAFETLLAANRARYCGTIEDVRSAIQAARAPFVSDDTPPTDEARPPAAPVASFEDQRDPVAPAGPERIEPVLPHPNVPPPSAREPGKGGSQHRYVQHLIKGLAEERGFRVGIEEGVEGGQVDVALHRDDLSIACEISVTSKADYEAQNLAKCLRAAFQQVWAIAPDQKRRRAIEDAARRRLSEDDIKRVVFLTTEDIVPMLDGLPTLATTDPIVRGYKVKVSRTTVSAADAKDRRDTIARVVANSIRRLDK